MASRELQVRIGVNVGSAESQLKALNVNIKNTKSEFDKAGAGIKDFEKTTEGAKVKIASLGEQLKTYSQITQVIKKQIKEAEETLKKSNEAYENQKKKVAELKSELEKAKDTYGENSKEVKALSKELKESEKSLQAKEKAVISADNKLVNLGTQLNKTEAEIKSMESEIKRLNNELDDIDSNNVDELGESFRDASEDATAFGAHMSEIGQGVRDVGESIKETGKEVLNTIGELVKSGSEYSAEVAGTDFLLKNLDSTTQDLISSSSELASSIGLTNKQYKDSATTIATYYKNMGMTTEQTNDLTSETMSLVADLAAITDMPFDDAMDRFKSGLMGNYEALDAFGINISANLLSNSEFVKSLGKSWNSLDDNTKMLAVYNEIVRQSSSAIGLASQEAQEFGMQSKLLSQRVEELKGKIGEKLLPVLQPFLQKINEIVQVISKWVEDNPELTKTILTIATVIGAVLAVVGTLTVGLGSMIIMWGAISTALATASIPFLAIAGVIAGVVAGIILLVGAVNANFEGIKEAFANLKLAFDENMQPLKEGFSSIWTTMQSVYDTVIQPLFTHIGELIEVVVNFIAQCMPGISTAFQIVCDLLKTIWDSVGAPVFGFVVEVVGMVVEWFKQYAPQIAEVFNSVMDSLKNYWENVGKPLWNIIKVIIEGIIDALKPIIKSLLETCGTVFEGIKSIWDNILKPVWDALSSVIGRVIEKVLPYMDDFKEAVTKAMEWVLSPIQWVIDKFNDLFGLIGKVADGVGGFISKFNPFKSKSLDLGVNLDTSGVQEFNSIALSGQYYNARTPRAEMINDFIRNGSSSEDSSTSELLNSMNKQNTILTKMLEALLTERETVVENTINLDGRSIAKGTAKFIEKEISNLNKRANRLSGLAY